jgi:hypothetical protein
MQPCGDAHAYRLRYPGLVFAEQVGLPIPAARFWPPAAREAT